jgi:hypothetical protein
MDARTFAVRIKIASSASLQRNVSLKPSVFLLLEIWNAFTRNLQSGRRKKAMRPRGVLKL